jgi:hypothetical protein
MKASTYSFSFFSFSILSFYFFLSNFKENALYVSRKIITYKSRGELYFHETAFEIRAGFGAVAVLEFMKYVVLFITFKSRIKIQIKKIGKNDVVP